MMKIKVLWGLVSLCCPMFFFVYAGEMMVEDLPFVCSREVQYARKDTLRLHRSAEEFVIDDLEKPTSLLGQIATKDLFVKLNAQQIEKYANLPDSLVYFGNQPFLLGLVKAYQEHRPFVISPDMIWLLIEQGFARHVGLHADKFRERLVGFDGQRELTVAIDDLRFKIGDNKSNWEQIFPQFVDQIEMYAGKDYVSNLRADFSTTDATSKMASEIVLMESVRAYFDYRVMMIGCGISSVTIEGSTADWTKVLQKIDYIESFDLHWWTNELKPIVQEIINTKKGVLNRDFWRTIVQLQDKAVYSPHQTIDGWITKFYPFTDKGEQRGLGPITHIHNIAAEYVKVPFVLEDLTTKKSYEMEFWSGLFAVEQDPLNYKLKPTIGWVVVRGNQKEVGASPKEHYDQVSLKNIKEIPQAFYELKNIDHLTLVFLGKVNISDRIKEIKIKRLYLKGEISKQEERRVKNMLPGTLFFSNGREVKE